MAQTGAYWKAWLRCAGMRALKTLAQTAAATCGASALITDVDWLVVGSASLMAAALSLLTSVAGLPELPEPEPDALIGDEWDEGDEGDA